jgi:hypothetical protein
MSDDAIIIGSYAQGEIPEPFIHTFLRVDGTPDALQPGTWSGQLIFRKWNTPTLTVKSATILDQTASPGQVSWSWATTDVSQFGDFEGELWVGNAGTARYRSQRFRWLVRPTLAQPTI